MKISNLKSAWSQFKLFNSYETIHEDEIMALIAPELPTYSSFGRRVIQNIIVFTIIILCCQAG